MSVELINRITFKKDGIYISTHSSNCDSPYYSAKSDYLTKAYISGGIGGLDRAVISMYFSNCDFRGSHESIMPYRIAINEAMNNKEFIGIIKEHRSLESESIDIENRWGSYKALTKEQSKAMHNEFTPKVQKLEDERNKFIIKIIEKERDSIVKKSNKEPKELRDGIYEIIPIHRINEGLGEIYDEYMNFNSNNGTIVYEKRLGNLTQSPEYIKIGEYIDNIEKHGIENIAGSDKFIEFIMKYPYIYQTGLDNEFKEETENELDKDNIEEL